MFKICNPDVSLKIIKITATSYRGEWIKGTLLIMKQAYDPWIKDILLIIKLAYDP